MLDRILPAPGPLRSLALATLVTTTGNGAWYTCWALFLTRSVGLSPAQVGIGISVAGVLGLLAATPMGHLADRLGPRDVLVTIVAVQALGSLAYAGVRGLWTFLPVACMTIAADRSTGGVRGALVVGLTEGEERLHVLASLRAVGHIGFALGSAIGAIVIALDARPAYLAMLAINAATYMVYASIVARLPRVAGVPAREHGPALVVLRDAPYVLLAAIAGVLALCWGMLSSALPLWVVLHTRAPAATSPVLVLFGSLGIAALQVRVTRGFTRPVAAARAAVWAGAALAAACVTFALSAGRGGAAAIAILACAAALHLAGELLFVAASWGLSVPLMPAGAAGQYQGMFATGEAAAQAAAPVLMTTVVVGWGQPGWLALGALFLLAVLPAPAITRWALSTRTTAVPAVSTI